MLIATALATALLLPITGRAPRRSRVASACLADLSLQYELATEELSIDDGSGVSGPLTAYVTEEQPREDSERVDRALILLPDASGWKDVQTRRLADRLAIFCSCVVLVPDLLRGEAACTQAPDDEAYASWLSALPPERVDRDVRACVVVLRADRRIRGPLTMLGLGLGGGQAVRANAGVELAGTALICPRHYERATLAAAKAPTLALFDGDKPALDEARDALLGPGAMPSTSEPPLSTLRVPELRADQHVRSGTISRGALPWDGRPTSRHTCLTASSLHSPRNDWLPKACQPRGERRSCSNGCSWQRANGAARSPRRGRGICCSPATARRCFATRAMVAPRTSRSRLRTSSKTRCCTLRAG